MNVQAKMPTLGEIMTDSEAACRDLGRRIACERPLVNNPERIQVAQVDGDPLNATAICRQVNSTQ